ncbi:MAG: chemotaxis response regulator protein-glutamate methylesterase [candidate division Zixibacteria bacterium]|jgi:two-component system chemotaxis response regulator CheB|nr:chemotaxis response regulator protein-glutamate methylesterase [candidate division Zixibacteria bacterium]
MGKARVLVVDDSAFMRKAISLMLESDPEIEVVGMASNGEDGIELNQKLKPDVITLDIEMPRMDGLTALKRIMSENPTPVMMISSLTTEGAEATLEALSLGAVDFIPKQLSFVALDIVKIKDELLAKIKHIARNKPRFSKSTIGTIRATSPKVKPVDLPTPPSGATKKVQKKFNIVAIGTSTGGPPALQAVLPLLPKNFPVPITVVQHMPATFTKSLADRLDGISNIHVKEAEHGEKLMAGTAYIAPGGKHLLVKGRPGSAEVFLSDEPRDTLHRPAVNVMVKSVADLYGGSVLGVIMTGMGSDGLEGIRQVKKNGGMAFAQNMETCVVYGMPRAIVDNGLADKVIPIDNMAAEIVNMF